VALLVHDAILVTPTLQEIVNDAITGALLQLFKNKHYVPLYPFKPIVQYLLREEASESEFSCSVFRLDSVADRLS
jgi:hypothetical protein